MANEYNRLLHEYVDLKSRDTRKALVGLSEADQDQLLVALTSKLYDKIVDKVGDIDFGTIPRSRGDITKIENYASLMECIDILRNIIVEYRENTYPIDVVSSAVENMKARTKTFSKAFALNVEMPIILYNTITLSIVSSVSFLISGCIEYIKDPGSETYTIALDKVGYNKTAQNLLFENLASFNSSCKNGEIDLALDDVIKNNRKITAECGGSDNDAMDHSVVVINIGGANGRPCKGSIYKNKMMPGDPGCPDLPPHDAPEPENFFDREMILHDDDDADDYNEDIDNTYFNDDEEVMDTQDDLYNDNEDQVNEVGLGDVYKIAKTAITIVPKAIITIAKCIVPLLQNLVYYFYYSKQSVSDYFAVQAELVQMNAYKVQYNTDIDPSERKKIYTKQMKMADKMKKISNRFSIDYTKSKKSADDLRNKDASVKYSAADLGYDAPMDAGTASIMF